MNDIEIRPVDEVYIKIKCDSGIAYELSDYFSFKIPNYWHHPLVRARKWDGAVRLFSARTKHLYRGLVHYVAKFAEERDYKLGIDPELMKKNNMSKDDVIKFLHTLNLPSQLESRDYQIEALQYCLSNNRGLIISPTGSGKSFLCYCIMQYFRTKTLIIVPSIGLLKQLKSDFESYGLDVEKYVHLIQSGSSKKTKKPVVVSTYQSAAKQPKDWFKQFNLIIGDEFHLYTAKSLKYIMESLVNAKYRFGVTGTLDGTKSNQMVLEGLTGEYKKFVSTKELMDQDYLSELEIRCIILKYPEDEINNFRKECKKDYQKEIEWINNNQLRNKFIEKLATNIKGNTLVLFQRVEQHGIPLFEAIKNSNTEYPVYFISGQTKGEEREEIRKLIQDRDNSISVVSYGTCSLGINIPNINNIITASSSKSQIRVLQTIGRGLRKSPHKYKCVLYDIIDDLSDKNMTKVNYTLRHFKDRVEMYAKEQFKYTIHRIQLGASK